MIKRIFAIVVIVIIIISMFVIPVSALDNTVGRVVEECPFVGISYSNSAYKPYRFAFDNVVYKYNGGSDFILSAGTYMYLYYDLPNSEDLRVTFNPSISLAGQITIDKVNWYGWNQVAGSDYGTRTLIKSGSVESFVYYNGYSSFTITPASFIVGDYDKICIAIVPAEACVIDGSYDEYVDLDNVEVRGFVNGSTGYIESNTGFIEHATGTIYESSSVVVIENHEMSISPVSFVTDAASISGYLAGNAPVVSHDSTNIMAASTLTATYGSDGGLVESVDNIEADIDVLDEVIETAISDQTTSINSKLNSESTEIQSKLNTESDELQTAISDQTSSINTKLNTESSEIQTKLNTESSEIQTKLNTESDELQTAISNQTTSINAKLNTESSEIQTDIINQTNKLSDQLQVIVDDYEAKTEQAGVISQGATQENVDNTAATMSTGYETLSAGAQTAGDLKSYSAPAGMYTGLLTATVTPLLNFGNGILYWAFFAIIVGSVILVLLRRLT